jgi:hypothetical protein
LPRHSSGRGGRGKCSSAAGRNDVDVDDGEGGVEDLEPLVMNLSVADGAATAAVDASNVASATPIDSLHLSSRHVNLEV